MKPPERLVIGIAAGAFGVHGEVKVHIETDFPERFANLKRVFIDDRVYSVESTRLHDGQALLKLAGIENPEDALKLKGRELQVELADAVTLPPGSYFIYEIEGLQVETMEGEALGVVAEVLRTGANDVYVVRAEDGSEILLPAIPHVIKEVDLNAGRMRVSLIEGLR